MKKVGLLMLVLALIVSLGLGALSASAAEGESGDVVTNLLDFESADYKDCTYDEATGSVTLGESDTRVYIPTLLDSITDGKVKLADGTEKAITELTYCMEATISPATLGVWTVPFLVFAKNGIDTYEYHLRANFVGSSSTSYIFGRADELGNYKEDNLTEIAVPKWFEAGDSYTVKIEFSGTKVLSLQVVAGGAVVAEAQDLEVLPEEYRPVFSFGGRTNKGSVISDMKFYVKDGEIVQDAGAEEEESSDAVTNLLDFESANFGKNFYDETTGEVMLYGDDTRVYIPTFLDGITDGKVKLADGTEKAITELTYCMEATISPAILGTWQVAYLVFAKNGIDTYEYHLRANISGSTSTSYVFGRADELGNYKEDNLKEIPVPVWFEGGDSYTVKIEFSGTKVLSLQVVVDGAVVAEAQGLEVLPEVYQPVFSFGDRAVGETVISDMKFYIKDGEVGKYAKKLVVEETPSDVAYGSDLTGGKFEVQYLDGTTEELALSDFTITGYDKNAVGTQTVTISKTVLNQQIFASFDVNVTDVETLELSVTKTDYAYGEDFDLSSIKVVKKFASGKEDESIATSASDFTISGYDKEVAGEQEVTVCYNGQDYKVKVTVLEKPGCGSSINASLFFVATALLGITAIGITVIRKKSVKK